ncbi:hypothetical protein rosmuc_02592 [Roseovarius mucosus DSM 17069]|uniref:Uncharacterized protein n=1 Tax=Roseovarius mucosus DSM 17069 TaxID=1288298 RepID=A0A0A0HPA1_9RHOB|nr:hypothetical protein [Roseovarius mucosus]KGM87853.1 hypothetical protein rosmuc_02592 [Roseovarius mucosus DSM 17069]
MKKTLTLLVASTALTAAIGVPAWSTMRVSGGEGLWPLAAHFDEGTQALPLVRVSDDDDDDDRDDRDDDDDDDDRGGARNPAPAGTVAPPQNGLFGTGTAPQVKVN